MIVDGHSLYVPIRNSEMGYHGNDMGRVELNPWLIRLGIDLSK